jgi:hypothetical protein
MKFFLFFLSVTCYGYALHSQAYDSDSLITARASHFAGQAYFNSRGHQLAIFNGPRCPVYLASIHGIAFFQDKSFRRGSVLYDDLWYGDIPMRYDEVAEELVVLQKDMNGIPSVLLRDRVKRFDISGTVFVRLDKSPGLPNPGYYQLVADGPLRLYIRRRKLIVEIIADAYRTGSVEREFQDKDEYYVLKNGAYHPVRHKKEILNLLRDKRREVIRLLNQSKLKFRQGPEAYITAACKYYNQSTN